ncbi:MAG: hypothetical protein ACYCST_02605 [Acidimicrobiales bacterium]
MIGLLSRRGLKGARRPKGRLAVWAAAAIVLAIVIGEVTADVVGSSGSASVMSDRTYAAAVVPIIDESTGLLPWLTDVRTRATELGRVGIELALGRLVSGSTAVEQQLAGLGIVSPSYRVGHLLAAAFAERTVASQRITGGVAQAIGPGRDARAAAASLVAAAADLHRADTLYKQFRDSLPGYVTHYVPLPSSTWYDSAQWSPSSVEAFAHQLESATGLRVHRSLIIVAVAVQPPALRITGLPTTTTSTTTTSSTSTTTSTTTTSTTTVSGVATSSTRPATTTTSTSTTSTTTTTTLQIPPPGSLSWYQPTAHLSVEVVVANAGNVEASHAQVVARLIPLNSRAAKTSGAGSGRSAKTHRSGSSAPTKAVPVIRILGPLAGGSSVEVTLPPLSCRPGGRYELRIKVDRSVESFRLQVAAG